VICVWPRISSFEMKMFISC